MANHPPLTSGSSLSISTTGFAPSSLPCAKEPLRELYLHAHKYFTPASTLFISLKYDYDPYQAREEQRNMAPTVDPAIIEALGLELATTKMATHGGSGFSSTFRLTGVVDGEEVSYFVKTGMGKDAEIMFRGEFSATSSPLVAIILFRAISRSGSSGS
jgi:hypothetical protein